MEKVIFTEKDGRKTVKHIKVFLPKEFQNNPNLETVEIGGLVFERGQFDLTWRRGAESTNN
tara:strand:+ start:740 stop:922 length:183 start_codon:yes stop_codon:yes gene_type:complete